MKRILFLLLLFSSLFCHAQNGDLRGKRVIVDGSLFLRNRWIDSIKNDTTGLSTITDAVPTAKTLYDFVVGRITGLPFPVTSVFSRTGNVTAQSADYSAFYPLLAGSYVNPSWIISLPWSKITSTPTTLSGYAITDAVPSSRNLATGYGLSGGGDLSANRTLIADSASLANYFLRRKDSSLYYRRFGKTGEDDVLTASRIVVGNNGVVGYDFTFKDFQNWKVIAGGAGPGTHSAWINANDTVGFGGNIVDITAIGNLILNAGTLYATGVHHSDGRHTLGYVQVDTTNGQFFYDPTIDSTSITVVGTIVTGTWWATPIDLAHGGTGSRLVDPGGDRLFVYDNTADSTSFWSLSTDFVFNHTTHTIEAKAYYYKNPIHQDSVFFSRVSDPDALYARAFHVSAASSKVSVSEVYTGDSLVTHSIDVVEANLTHNNIGGILNAAHGGTGANNGSSVFTMGGNVTYSGAFTFTATVTANTAITYPTSGTLYGTASGSFASAALATSLSDETGTGVAVFGTSPTISNLLLSNMPTISTATTNYFYVGGSSGLLAQTGQVQINAGGEVLIGGITDQGAYALQVGTGATYIGGNLTYAQQLSSTKQTLTDGATITWNWNSGTNAEVTLGGNRTLSITNAIAGTYGTIRVVQDGTGSRTLALPASSKVISGGSGAITLSTAASSVDVLTVYYDGTSYFWTYGKNYN
jgi:hypothetical protein